MKIWRVTADYRERGLRASNPLWKEVSQDVSARSIPAAIRKSLPLIAKEYDAVRVEATKVELISEAD